MRNGFSAVITCWAFSFVTGCGVWGEKPVGPKTIDAPAAAPCPELTDALTQEMPIAQETLDCWRDQIKGSLEQVEGGTKDVLTPREVGTLIDRRVLKLGGSPSEDREKMDALLRMFGWQNIEKRSVDDWFGFLEKDLPQIRQAYSNLRLGLEGDDSYERLQFIFETAERVLNRLPSSFDVEQLTQDLTTVFNVGPWVGPTLRFLTEFAPSVCPGLIGSGAGQLPVLRFAQCLIAMAQHFQGSSRWWDWHFSKQEEMPSFHQLAVALTHAETATEQWFARPDAGLASLSTQSTLDFIAALGVPAPQDFRSSLAVLSRLNRFSTPEALHAADLLPLVRMISEITRSNIAVMPDYFEAVRDGTCEDPDAKSWKQCVPKNLPVLLAKGSFEKLRYGYVPESQALVHPANGQRFVETSLHWALAKRIMIAFDGNNDGVLSANVGDKDHNEMIQLITTMLRSGELASSMISNVDRRLRGLEPLPFKPNEFFRGLDMNALAKVITLAGTHSLVHRGRDQTMILGDLLNNLINLFPGSSVHLDLAGIFGVLNALNLLPRYERYMVEKFYDRPGMDVQGEVMVRSQVTRALDDAMPELFTKSAKGCEAFGMSKTCDGIFNRFVPFEPQLRSYDLDASVLFAMMIEGTFFHCDDGGDGKLSLSVLNGDDELDCGYVKLKDLVVRLGESHILPMSDSQRRSLEFALEFFNSTFLTRSIGKVAMARGSRDSAYLNPILLPFNGTATLGSIYHLILEETDPSKAK